MKVHLVIEKDLRRDGATTVLKAFESPQAAEAYQRSLAWKDGRLDDYYLGQPMNLFTLTVEVEAAQVWKCPICKAHWLSPINTCARCEWAGQP